ncbi:MAG TPA: hypothetical protein VNX21_08925 [Candidatus Thermoplasmatota archaeon]|nr:hypothetical protein [Candidatus Thermoplasmatota archaeon]
MSPMAASAFFREPVLPSHEQDRRAHERFLLDTHAERRAEPQRPLVRRVLASLGIVDAA